MRGTTAVSYSASAEQNGYSDFFSFKNKTASSIGDVKRLVNSELPPVFSEIVFSLKNILSKVQSKSAQLAQKVRIESDRIVNVEYEEKQLKETINEHT